MVAKLLLEYCLTYLFWHKIARLMTNQTTIKQTRFNRLSDTIVGRIDDMGAKIDELEKSINDLMEQTGAESMPSSGSAAKTSTTGMKRWGGSSFEGQQEKNVEIVWSEIPCEKAYNPSKDVDVQLFD